MKMMHLLFFAFGKFHVTHYLLAIWISIIILVIYQYILIRLTMDPILKSIKAISEEIRLRIIMLLIDREACVCELMEVFDMAQSKLSHHLIILRNAGLLHGEKRGKWNYYRLNTSQISAKNSEIVNLLSKSLSGGKTILRDKRVLAEVRRRKFSCRKHIRISSKTKILKRGEKCRG
jgi:ArsR family transcriptional regulator